MWWSAVQSSNVCVSDIYFVLSRSNCKSFNVNVQWKNNSYSMLLNLIHLHHLWQQQQPHKMCQTYHCNNRRQTLTLPVSFIDMLTSTDQPPEQQRIAQLNDCDLTELLSCVQVLLNLCDII